MFSVRVYSGEVLDFGFDWSAVIPSADSIESSTWFVSPELVTTKEETSQNVHTIWLTDFSAGTTYTLTNEVLMAISRRKLQSTIVVMCESAESGAGITVYGAIDTDDNEMVWTDGSRWIFTEIT